MNVNTQEVEYRFTFKYLKFSDNSLKPLTDSTIKFTSPLEFNDPFDCHPKFEISSPVDYRKRAKDYWQKKRRAAGVHKSAMKQLPPITEQLMSLKAKMTSGELRQEMLQRYGIFSMCLDPSHMLMWSHYADEHRGFVLGFRSPLNSPTEDGIPEERIWELLCGLKVEYQEDRPVVRYPEIMDDADELVRRLLLIKSSVWEYEQEVRCIDSKRGPGVRTYDRNETLCSVILGSRISDPDRGIISTIVDDLKSQIPELEIYQAQLHPDKFEVVIPSFPNFD